MWRKNGRRRRSRLLLLEQTHQFLPQRKDRKHPWYSQGMSFDTNSGSARLGSTIPPMRRPPTPDLAGKN